MDPSRVITRAVPENTPYIPRALLLLPCAGVQTKNLGKNGIWTTSLTEEIPRTAERDVWNDSGRY